MYGRNRLGFVVVAGVAMALVGCMAQGNTGLTVKPSGTATAKPAGTSPALKAVNGIDVTVLAPSSLLPSGAAAGSVIQATDADALAVARGVNILASGGGNVIASGGGNILASGGGNILASGGGNFRVGDAALQGAPRFQLLATINKYANVAGAVVHLESLDGKLVSTTAVKSTADGSVVIPLQHQNVPILAVARFKVNGTTYQLSCPIGTNKPPLGYAYAIDPINTIVQGRIRTILNANGAGAVVTHDELKAVWSVFNDAEVEVALDTIKEGATLADLDAFYKQMITKVPEAKRKLVVDYMGKLNAIATARGDAAATPATPDASATADVKATL